MGLFDKLFRSKPKIGNTDPVCPYCSVALQKMPGRKKCCPNCKNEIYVRTRPSDNMKILIREDQVLTIDEQWSIKNGTHKQFLAEQNRRNNYIQTLAKRFGRQPSANDVEWAMLNDDVLTHASRNDWGLYRNARFSMANILKKEGKQQQYLIFLLEVCYLDLNGPNNCGGVDEPSIRRQFPPFNPKEGDLAPGIVGPIADMIDNSETSISDVQQLFIQTATQVQKSLSLTVSPETAWRKLKKEITAT